MPEHRQAHHNPRATVRELVLGLHDKLDHLHDLIHETNQRSKFLMVKATDLDQGMDTLISDVESTTDVITAIATAVDGMNARQIELQQQLAEALANGADPAVLESISNKMAKLNSVIDGQQMALAAIKGTPAETPQP